MSCRLLKSVLQLPPSLLSVYLYIYVSEKLKGSYTEITVHVQGNQLYMAVYFWYILKRYLSIATVKGCKLEKSLFTRYQNNTAISD